MNPGLSALLLAQIATPSPPADQAEEIVVRALRIERAAAASPAAITIRDADDLKGLQGLSLAEGVAGIPGVYAQNRNNFAQDLRVSIRGFGARGNFGVRGVKILLDGIPATLPDGQSQVDSIILGNLNRIEVLRGGASALYGNSSGGVINLESQSLSGGTTVSAGLDLGDSGYHRSHAQVDGGSEALAYRVSAWEMNLDGYRDHAEAEAAGGELRFQWEVDSNTEAAVLVNYFDAPLEQDPGGINAAQAAAAPRSARDRNILFDAGEKVEQWRFGTTLSKVLDGRGQLDGRAYWIDRQFENLLPFVGGGAVDLNRDLWGAGLTWQSAGVPWAANATLQAGLEFDQQHDRRRRFDNNEGLRGDEVFDQTEKVSGLGLFLQGIFPMGRGELTAGLRYDRLRFKVNDRFLADGDDAGTKTVEEVSPSVAYSFPLTQRWTAFAGLGTSFESPTTTELANPAGGGFNDDLDAQTARHLDLGVRGAWGPVDLDLALFLIEIDDELTPFELPEFPGRSFFQNAGESERQGVEADLGWQLLPEWRVALNYTYSDFEYDQFVTPDADFSGLRLPGVPRHQANASINYVGAEGYFANATARYGGDLFANNANSTRVASYSVVDFRAGRTWAWPGYDLSLNIGVNNLTNEDYFDNIRINAFGGRYFEPAPDRQIYGGVEISWHR